MAGGSGSVTRSVTRSDQQHADSQPMATRELPRNTRWSCRGLWSSGGAACSSRRARLGSCLRGPAKNPSVWASCPTLGYRRLGNVLRALHHLLGCEVGIRWACCKGRTRPWDSRAFRPRLQCGVRGWRFHRSGLAQGNSARHSADHRAIIVPGVRGAAQQADAADEAGASDGASQLIRSVRRTRCGSVEGKQG
jgi:hypothetical protein